MIQEKQYVEQFVEQFLSNQMYDVYLQKMLSNKVSLEGDGGQFDEQDTLVVQIKRWSRQHALLLGPTVVEMKEENKFADVFWPEIGDIEAESVEDILLPMPSSYAIDVQTHRIFVEVVVYFSYICCT